MKTLIVGTTGVVLAGLVALTGCSSQSASAGPNGGDLVPIKDGTAYAEVLANADTGGVMVHTWDKDLKTPKPIESAPIGLGSGDKSIELMPHPLKTDPAGKCSRFYGDAEWLRGGAVRNGWMRGGGIGDRTEFAWQRCWQGGKSHGPMWEEMGRHGRGGAGHGPGHHGGMSDQ